MHYPHHFSTTRRGGDHIELDGWNEDGSHVVTISLTHATAVELIRDIAAELAKNPYAR